MEIHFTVRLVMVDSNRNKSCPLESWTVRVLSKVQWESRDRSQTLDEHDLGTDRNEDKEHDLLLKWCNNEFTLNISGRSIFVNSGDINEINKVAEDVKDPGSEEGLNKFASLLKKHFSTETTLRGHRDTLVHQQAENENIL
jgi:hypothetical protein